MLAGLGPEALDGLDWAAIDAAAVADLRRDLATGRARILPDGRVEGEHLLVAPRPPAARRVLRCLALAPVAGD